MLSDENESNFRDFSNALLAAEETVHRAGGVTLYSSEALQKILSTFCGIVARDIDAQSCTIHLKLHDIGSCKFIEQLSEADPPLAPIGPPGLGRRTDEELEQIAHYRERLAQDFRTKWEAAKGLIPPPENAKYGKDDATRRDSILRGANAFPHCVYAKGAMWLIAANDTSPWLPFVGWLITELSRGVTAEIVQEKSARVRDPFNIRQSRAYRKLGEVDPYIWTNKRPAGAYEKQSPRFFFNYYAVPIRIHSGGDVIGIIKIENKGFAYDDKTKHLHDALNDILDTPHTAVFDDMLAALARKFEAATAAALELKFEPRERSLLSLVYLAYDLSRCPAAGGTIESLLSRSFIENEPAPLRPGERPPLQIFFDSIGEERRFLNWLARSETDGDALSAARDFYIHLNGALSEPAEQSLLRSRIENGLESFLLRKQLTATITAQLVSDIGRRHGSHHYPDFLYKISITNVDNPFQFHVQVCPSENESGDKRALERYWEISNDRSGAYKRAARRQKELPALSGEYIKGTEKVIHLRTDRYAARVHALTYAFPVPSFSVADSWKLSWAALEIGKLIERQISYRGTHVAPTVPLTSDDFFRIPISDLSFVDAVRRQYASAEAADAALEYHIPNICRQLGLTWGITVGSRVKGLRSYFDRIGQSHRAHHDALLALWSYILIRKITPQQMEKLESLKLTRLFGELKTRIEPLLADEWKTELGDWLDEDVLPDIRFAAPPLKLADKPLKAALEILLKNLAACPTGIQLTEPPDVEDLAELLYRRYDAFVVFAVSLYLQLESTRRNPKYLAFYAATRRILDDLRQRLEASEQQSTQAPNDPNPIGTVGALLGELRSELFSISTRKLAEKLDEGSPETTELLRFSVHGIYKRIRTLANVAGNQTPPAMLNWESGRFDYLGGRVTCLFKNQVFAIYEQLWTSGDPFRSRQTESSTSRQRWLCLRTKVHVGNEGYHAWQISALMDPDAMNENYWDGNAFTLNALRDITAAAYRRWHTDSPVYDSLARTRVGLRDQYCNWFRNATAVLDRLPAKGARDSDPFFGKYLGETALDLLVHLLRLDPDLVDKATLHSLVSTLQDLVEKAWSYSDAVVMPLMRGGSGTFAPANGDLLDAANRLYEQIETLANASKLTEEVKKSLCQMEEEQELLATNTTTAQAPVIFVTPDVLNRVRQLGAWIGSRGDSDDHVSSGRSRMEDLVRRIQASQMDYLFQLHGDSDSLPLRNEADVMDRVICYILLHHPSAYDSAELSRDQRIAVERAPGAYNLFYYAMSLIPVEIQVRTALANTMAEQYHKIYKIGPEALSTMIQQERLKGIGQELDMMDREFEVQFEDYIHKTNG
jgi:hypothetical protein